MNINQYDGIKLLTEYWYEHKNRNEFAKYIFVGDVHGDINQFILPLIETETITLENKIETVYKSKYEEANIYLPKFKINKSDVIIYYLGDLIDEGNFSRNIVYMINYLFENECKNIRLCFGNHDLNILGSINSYYNTLIKELTPYPNVSVCNNKCYYKCKENNEFLNEYLKPLQECMLNLFKKRYGNICYLVNDMVVSHTIITGRTLDELIENKSRLDLKDKTTLVDGKMNDKWINILKNHENESLIDVVESINNVFYHSKKDYIIANSLTYNRMDKNKIFYKNIVGHTEGGLYRSEKLLINPIPATYDFERQIHTQHTNGVYFFDINASSGYDIDNVSRMDYFYLNDKNEMKTTKTYAIRLFYNYNDAKLELQIYKGKFKFDGVIQFKK